MKELYSNGFASSIAQAIEEMKAEQGDGFSLDPYQPGGTGAAERCISMETAAAQAKRISGSASQFKRQKTRCHKVQWLHRHHRQLAPVGYQELFGHTGYSLSAFHAGACPARNDVDFYEFCDESNLTIIHEMIVREH